MNTTPYLQWITRHPGLNGAIPAMERQQAQAEGRDLSSVEAEFARLLAEDAAHDEAWYEAARDLSDKVQTLPFLPGRDEQEPSELAAIRAMRPASAPLPRWTGDSGEFLSRLHGGLLGRLCGCMLGKPVESWYLADIITTAKAQGNWPLADYFRSPTEAERAVIAAAKPRSQFTPEFPPLSWLKNGFHGTVPDDDINYTMIGFLAVKRFGAAFTPLDIATLWAELIPIFKTFTAERMAYRNFINSVLPPESATHKNPYREFIGAQIRADYFGFANPGNPERAAEWGWRDASVSHIKNGIYGEMWVAAMLAAAYVEGDWLKIIRAGLAQIPAQCRLTAAVERVIATHQSGAGFEEAVAQIHAEWDETQEYGWCHTISNAMVVTAGLLYGNNVRHNGDGTSASSDDYEKTISLAVMAAFDTDCNGATCGSIWGVKNGAGAIPEKWPAPFQNLMHTTVTDYETLTISALAKEMAEVAEKSWEK